ncbi:amino acid adenylation domain-containing protein [Streptomyces sp. NPDC002566]|uniref:amino acid adenylation domain-containing protein n=1 Tax=Streptomyces sp. NPDC002566 TaxID=3364650 RepID=UPI0036894958
MSVTDLMARLRTLDIRLWTEDGRLRYSAPDGALTPELRAELRAARDELVALLGARPAQTPVTRRPAAGPAPLSAAQRRLWLLDRMDPGNAAYGMHAAVRLRGGLDVDVLRRCVREITDRHEVLRTTFHDVEGRPEQRVADSLEIPLELRDLRRLPRQERAEEVARAGAEEARRGFDLAAGPLLRTVLLRSADDEHVLLLTMHHIVSDGWSVSVLINELVTLYTAFSRGEASPLPPLAVQYADYAAWQAEWLAGDGPAGQLAHWRERLHDAPTDLALPLDRPRPAVQTFRAMSTEGRLAPEVTAALRRIGQEEGATLFMTMLTAFNALMARHSGQDDLVVGIPESGRNRSETEPLIGCFVNTLALRTDLSGDPDFRTALRRVRDTALDAYAHSEIPFEQILTELKTERRLDRTPVFQVFFNMVPFSPETLRLPGLEAEIVSVPETGAKFDLTLYVSADGGTLTLVHNADLFDAARAAELMEQYRALLAAVAADADLPLARYSLVTAGARELLPDPRSPLPAVWDGPVHEAFARRATETPDALAVRDPGEALTYGELAARAREITARVEESGLGDGDLVAVHGPRGAAMVAALLGVLGAGAGFVVLDPAEPAVRLAEQIRTAGVRGWIAVSAPGDAPHEPAPELEAALTDTAVVRLSAAPGTGSAAAARAGRGTGTVCGPDTVAYAAFTSGSTGRPKAVLGGHGPLAHFVSWYARDYGLTAGDRFALLSAPGHDPMLRDVFTPLALGAALYVPDHASLKPGELAAWLDEQRITVANLTPATLDFMLSGAEAVRNASLRLLFFSGDRLLGGHIERARSYAPDVRCVNFYGATETPQAVSAYEVPAPGSLVHASPGVPSDAHPGLPAEIPLGAGTEGAQLVLRNRAGLQTGVGELGEIHVRSPYLALGYAGSPEATAERFVPAGPGGERAYRTGDLGRYRPDGSVQFVGRADRQVQIRGFRVEPGETEAALRSHPGVADAVVTAASDGTGVRLAAHVTPAAGTSVAGLDPRELRGHLRGLLPDYMVPTAWSVLPELPRLANGKPDLRSLPEAVPPGATEEYVAPSGATEEALAQIWAEVLQVPRVGARDDFFELGGHSLLATVITHRIREQFGAEIAIRSLFEAPTVADLARRLEEPGALAAAPDGPGIRAVRRAPATAGLDDLLARLGDISGGAQ